MISSRAPACRWLLPKQCLNGPPIPAISIRRVSSLSAIHRGLRRSRTGGSQAIGRDPEVAQHVTERRRARLAAVQPAYKISRGKKDITERFQPEPTGKSASFYNPDDPFGKKSAVYKFKTGQLQEELEDLRRQKQERDRGSGVRDGTTSESAWSRLEESSGSPGGREPPSRTGRSRGGDGGGVPRTRPPQDRMSRNRREPFPRRHEYSDRASAASPRASRSSISGSPSSLPFTTAASQFLYGKSVVEAAMKTGRRKLYKLYIYGGANRKNVVQDQALENLARRIGLETVILAERDQPLMDKMSQGRPHNGYLLEASPLPQLPVTALGELSTSDEFPGYQVSLGHQSHEETQVNGTDDFVPATAGRYKPLVLFLDGVRDPGNLGAILRSASFLGINAVAISNRTSTTLTPVALKASAGASETTTLFSVDSPAEFLARSKEAGWKVFAAVPTADRRRPGKQLDLRGLEREDPLKQDPCILLVGSEGDGLPRLLRSKADVEVTIPNQSGSNIVDSLNVSVAAGLLCSSFVKGQLSPATPTTRDELELWGV